MRRALAVAVPPFSNFGLFGRKQKAGDPFGQQGEAAGAQANGIARVRGRELIYDGETQEEV